jgi:hypothetical protein
LGDEIKKNEVGVCTHVGEKGAAYRLLVGKLRERDRLEYLVVNRRIIFSYIFKNWNRRHKLD